MPKIPDFSKFDLQSIVNSVKTMINPEPSTPKVEEGDPIGTKIVQISTLLQNVTNSQSQSAKDLTQINNLLNELYKDLEAFRKLEAEVRFKQQTETRAHPQAEPTSPTPESMSTPTTGQVHSGIGEPSEEKIEPVAQGDIPPSPDRKE